MSTKPPQVYGLKALIKSALETTAIKNALDPNGEFDSLIQVLKSNRESAKEPNSAMWNRIVIMDRTGLINATDYLDHSIHKQINIRVDSKPMGMLPDDYDVDAYLQTVHGLIFDHLHGKKFTLERATVSMPLFRIMRPTGSLYSERGFWYNASTYKTILTSYE